MADHENLPAWTVGVKAARRLTERPRPSARSTASLANFSAGQSSRAMRSPSSTTTGVSAAR